MRLLHLGTLVFVGCTESPIEEDPISVPIDECQVDADCADANPCDGDETCVDGACAEGEAVVCDDGLTCVADDGLAVCDVWCVLPTAPNLSILLDDDVLTFEGPGIIETAVLDLADSVDDAVFVAETAVGPFDPDQPVRILARTDAPGCTPDDVFDLVYDVATAYPGAAGSDGSEAVPADVPVAWGGEATRLDVGEAVDEIWVDVARALGPADGTSEGVLSIGRGGAVIIELERSVGVGPGPELAVFENGFSDTFLELGRVAVSTDGEHFASFDIAARTSEPIGPFDNGDPTRLHGLAGVYRQGFGTPFDLDRLWFDEFVRRGFVRLDAIRYVRIEDVVGDGADLDAWGRPVHDPYPTMGSAGFDLDAIGVLDPS
ncbi:MAG: hypothetical protein AAF211_17545 [Myxococcota bacterium]